MSEIAFPEIIESAVDAKPAPALVPALVTIKDATLAQFTRTEADLRTLAAKFDNVAFDVATPKGLTAAKQARQEIRDARFTVQRIEKNTKAELNDLKSTVSDTAAALIAIIEPAETNAHNQIKAHEEKLAAEKAERERLAAEAERIEAERLAAHHAGLVKLRSYPELARGLTSEQIHKGLSFLLDMTFGPEWEEFCDEAAEARDTSIARLSEMHAAALNREAEAARVEAQRVENARVAAELAETQRKLDEQAAALKQRQDDIDRAEREKQAQRDAEAAAARFTTTPAEVYNPAPEACSSSAHDNQACDSPVAESEQQADPSEALQAVAAQSLDMPEAAALDPREAWAEFEGALLRVMPKIQKHAAAGDLCRFIASLERMREVMA